MIKYLLILLLTLPVYAEDLMLLSSFRIRSTTEAGKSYQYGTGFYYRDKVITAAHVVDEGSTMFFAEIAGAWYELALVKQDVEADTAVLKFKNTPLFKPLNLKRGTAKEGEYIHAYMGVDGKPIVHKAGVYVNTKSDVGSYLGIINISSNHGASGSAILNKQDKVIGMLIQGYVMPEEELDNEEKALYSRLFKFTVTKNTQIKNMWQIVPIKVIDEVIDAK